ncbi:MAG: hypothetical protein LC112_10945 [Flavobacteriales bacterium]|nr:hypothetical protein [Flavobacteriales bacterium]
MTETPTQEKVQNIFEIEKLQATQLPELQGLKEKQIQIVEENPFVEIIDNKTFEDAKKSRTNLVSARTEIQNQDKTIASKIKKFREMVAGVSAELIAITKPHEDKQQEEVRRWEAVKEKERLEKQKLEDERISLIKGIIEGIYQESLTKIDKMTFSTIETVKSDLEENAYQAEVETFQEFELDYMDKVNLIKSVFAAKEKQLSEIEAQRVEAENLKAERAKLEADRKELEAKQSAENARIAKEKEAAEAEQLRIQNAQKEAQAKIDADRKELEDEKNRIAKAEADKKAKEEADRLAVEKAETDRIQAESEAKRIEALKPEKQKAIDYLNNFGKNFEDIPEIKDEKLAAELARCIDQIKDSVSDAISTINNFK